MPSSDLALSEPLLDERELAEALELDRQIRVHLARIYAQKKDVLGWGKMLFPKKFNLPFCVPLHGYLVDIRRDPFTNTEAPRGDAKTTIKCFLVPIFQALNEPIEYVHYANVQATAAKALSINSSIKHEIETNQEILEIYGNQMGNDKWSDTQFVLRNGTVFTAVSAGQSIRGINYNNVRPDYVIVDDLYDVEDINNPESTEKKNDWFWGELYPALSQSKKTSLHVQGTAINNEDLLEKLKSNPDVKSRTFKTVIDWEKKLVLWPELKSFDEVMREKDGMPTTIWFREKQNERRDETSAIVKTSWLKDWEYDPAELKFDKHHFIQAVLLGCDPSIGSKVENDFTGVAVVLKTGYDDGRGNDYWIDDLRNEKLSLDKRVILLQELCDARPLESRVTQANIEGIAGFKDFVAEVKRRTNLPVREIDRVPDKITNLENKSHYFENGKVHLNKNIDPKLKDALKYQLTTNHPKHDDLRDSVLLTIDQDAGLWNFV